MSHDNEFLFVYGTLLRQSQSPMSSMLSTKSRFVGNGYVNGKLYDIGEYPGAILTNKDNEKIQGEVFNLKNPAATLRELDFYEECSDKSPWPHEFKRIKATVTLDSGKRVTAWIYEFNLPTDSYSRIESGDYMSYLGLVVT